MKLCEQNGVISRALPVDILAFSPPLIISEAETQEMIDIVAKSLDQLTVELRRADCGRSVRQARKVFFFEKKNQKTFIRLRWSLSGATRRTTDGSLFASFSSEKEGLPSS